MPQIILKFPRPKSARKYLVWSTIPDAPISNLMTVDELTEWIRAREGSEGVHRLADRLRRADEHGTSAWPMDATLQDTVRGNRAGPREKALTISQMIKKYGKV